MSLTNDAPSTHPKLAAGTEPGNRYQPLPGDIVSVDCRGIAAKYDQHGTRIGTVRGVSGAHGQDTVLVELPGWPCVLFMEPEWLELVRR